MPENDACGVYKIESVPTGHVYYGSSVNINCRWETHLNALKNKKHHNKTLQSIYDAHGKNCFRLAIVVQCEPHERIEMESEIICNEISRNPLCVNSLPKMPANKYKQDQTDADMQKRTIAQDFYWKTVRMGIELTQGSLLAGIPHKYTAKAVRFPMFEIPDWVSHKMKQFITGKAQ